MSEEKVTTKPALLDVWEGKGEKGLRVYRHIDASNEVAVQRGWVMTGLRGPTIRNNFLSVSKPVQEWERTSVQNALCATSFTRSSNAVS